MQGARSHSLAAAATCNLSVGASRRLPRAGVGAARTQPIANRHIGPAVLDGLACGSHPATAIGGTPAGDKGKGLRRIRAVAARGRAAVCNGGNAGQGRSVAGDMLAGEAVIADTMAAFLARDELPLPERALAAPEAGGAARSDRRGRRSAALKLVAAEGFPAMDLRVDEHCDPPAELSRRRGLACA